MRGLLEVVSAVLVGAALGEVTDGARTGLSATLLTAADFDRARFVARLRTVCRDDAIGLARHDIHWDGKDFRVQIARTKLEPGAVEQAL